MLQLENEFPNDSVALFQCLEPPSHHRNVIISIFKIVQTVV